MTMTIKAIRILSIVIILTICPQIFAGPLDEWEFVYPQPTPNPIHDAVYTNGIWVAVGDVGTILTSSDNGDTWVRQESGITNSYSDFHGITYAEGLFVAVGTDGLAATSPDGTNWTIQSTVAPTYDDFYAVTYGDGRFVAVGPSFGFSTNIVATSEDGINWTRRAAAVPYELSDVIYADGLFVAVGGGFQYTSPGTIMTSTDGITWTAVTSTALMYLGGVTYGNGMFVAVGNRRIYYSTDGAIWNNLFDASAIFMNSVAYGDGVFTAVGAEASYGTIGYFYSSTNGTNWTVRDGPSSTDRVRYGNGRFVAVGSPEPWNVGYHGTVAVSDGGTNWSPRSFSIPWIYNYGLSQNIIDITGNTGNFVAIMDDYSRYVGSDPFSLWYYQDVGGTPTAVGGIGNKLIEASLEFGYYSRIMSSTNAFDWTFETYLDAPVNGFASLGDRILGVGDMGYVFWSDDGTTWSNLQTGVSENLYAAARGGGTYVAVGQGGRVVHSDNLTTWSAGFIGGGADLHAVTYDNGRFVSVGAGGSILTSTNGADWDISSSPTTQSLGDIIYCFGLFHAFGSGGTWLTSPDGLSWTEQDPLTEYDLHTAAFLDGKLFVAGSEEALLVSSDGIHWVRKTIGYGYSGPHWNMIKHNGRLITANEGGVSESTTGLDWRFHENYGYSYDLVANGNTIVAVGYGYDQYSSGFTTTLNNGLTWMNQQFESMGPLNGVTYGNGQYVAVGEDTFLTSESPIYTSPEGTNWTLRSSGTTETFARIAYGNGIYVATLENLPQVVTSPDGVTWTIRETGVSGGFDGIEFLNNQFVAVGSSVAVSANGIDWTEMAEPGVGLIDITYALGMYAAVGKNGAMLTSSDLTGWTSHWTGTRQILKGIQFFNDRFVVAGYGALVLQSGYLTNTPAHIVNSPMDLSLTLGETNILTVGAEGRAPLSYQWYKDGSAISGANSSSLDVSYGGELGAGVYYVIVSNEFGSQQSASATVSVSGPMIMLTYLPPVPTNESPRLRLEGPTNQSYEIQYTEQLGTNADWYYGDYLYIYDGPQESYLPSWIDYTNAFFRAVLEVF